MAGRFVAAVSAVAGMVTGGSGGSVSSTTNHGTGGGGGGNSSGLYGSTPESNGRIFSRSLEAGGGGAGGRILGSLRESAHHFLDASTNSLSPHQLNYPPALMHQQQHVPATPFAVQPGSIPPFATASPSPTTVAATAWTAGGGGILKFGDIASLSTSAENMLTILNLLSIRAHAVNVVAEERHAELSQLAVAQLAAATSTSSGAGGLSGSLSIGAGTAAAAAVAADEVLTLYLGALGTYQSAMEIAKVVWDREQARRKGDPAAVAAAAAPPLVALAGAGDGTTGDGASSAAAAAAAAGTVDLVSLSAAVQWIRERFNECLERAEEARRWIPGESSGSAVGSYSSSEDGPVGRPRSFERLLYERALDIAKVAATHEAEGRLREAEADYVRAGLLLESAVQSVATAGAGGGGGSSLSPQSQDGSGTGAAAATAAAESDRVVMEQFIASLMKRLAKVQQLARGS